MGSATVQGQLWGIHAQDFAAYLGQVALPLQGAVLDAAHVTPGTRLLDARCGAGFLALLASLRGARVTALDASAALLAIARERLTAAVVREGDLEALPFADASFDAVTAVNSIFYAADMAAAMRELSRVVRPGGRVVVTAWGPAAGAVRVSGRPDVGRRAADAAPAARHSTPTPGGLIRAGSVSGRPGAGGAARCGGGRGRLSLRLVQR
jgi:SAM-dependent methyltransferase